MVTADEVRGLKGKRVTLRLSPKAGYGERVTGKVVGIIEAADGAVVAIEPQDMSLSRLSIHYQHIEAVEGAGTS